MALPLPKPDYTPTSDPVTLATPPTGEFGQAFRQLDRLLGHYGQVADGKTYRRASSTVSKLKHDTVCAAARGSDTELLRAALVQEVYDLAWAIYES